MAIFTPKQMTEKEQFILLLTSKLKELGLYGDETWQIRLQTELKEVISKNEIPYFLNTHQECLKTTTYYDNEFNSIIPFLLGICRDFDVSKPPKYDYGEWPDIDVDFLDGVRQYLKEDYARKTFGDEYVCNIANYNTFGIKGALSDMARVFNQDFDEVKAVTKNLKDKDDDNKQLTWEQSLEVFDDLKSYCEAHPDVADAAKRLVGRIRGKGQHASGLVISRVPIREYIPLIAGKDDAPASAWPEGISGTDLSTVGFIKFDFLGLDGNEKIADTCKMANEFDKDLEQSIHVVRDVTDKMTVCALPGQPSWSDTSYLNDPKSLKMASDGNLRMIFQFDGSPGIRYLARKGGVNSFDDLVAYTALYRPGPMKLKYHENYIKRKQGLEEWVIHPSLKDGPGNLSFTYGVLTYQEQIMRMLNTIGGVPLQDCEAVRKAISKKKIEKFQKYKDMFVENGQTLGFSVEELEHLWEQIEAFAGYGFNLSHAVGYSYISSRMLWLKAHKTKYFFASMFTHTKASSPKDYQKLKDYKHEAEKCGVKMAGLDINKSKEKFYVDPKDEKVYYGFSKIKGIGEDTAKRLESLQPYAGFEDFLSRFGTEAKTIHAIIALGCFGNDKLNLFKFYEFYKKWEKGENDRTKRHQQRKKLLEERIANATDFLEKADWEKKLVQAIANKGKKDQFSEKPLLATFNPETYEIKKSEKNDEFLELISDSSKAEIEYYGYIWQHPVEKCQDYQGYTFENFKEEENDGKVEVIIRKIGKKKGAKVSYYSIEIEDATGWKRKMTTWEDDYLRFEDELQVGNIVRLHVGAPKPPYPTYTLHQLGTKWKKPGKAQDGRVIKLD